MDIQKFEEATDIAFKLKNIKSLVEAIKNEETKNFFGFLLAYQLPEEIIERIKSIILKDMSVLLDFYQKKFDSL